MNTKNNQRSRSTDEKIIRAVYRQITDLHKPISRITVREVCEETQINRSTFYAHYQDIYDVVEKVERQMSEMLTASVLETIEQTGSLSKLYEQVFRFVKEHQQFYKIFFSEMGQWQVIGIAWDMFSDRFTPSFYQEIGFHSQEEISYAGAFFIHGLTGMLQLWLQGGCKESPEEMVWVLVRQFTDLPKLYADIS